MSWWVPPLTPHSNTHSLPGVLPPPLGLILQQSLRHLILAKKNLIIEWYSKRDISSWVTPERDPKQRNLWAITPLWFMHPPPMCLFSPMVIFLVWGLLTPYWIPSPSPYRQTFNCAYLVELQLLLMVVASSSSGLCFLCTSLSAEHRTLKMS